MKKIKSFDILLWIICIVFIGLYFTLPDNIPTHWNLNWDIDGYGHRSCFLVLCFLPIICYYGMIFTKKVDPRRKNLEKRIDNYEFMRRLLAMFFILLTILYYYMIKHPNKDYTVIVMIMMGSLFIQIGNELPRIPQNYYLGIKTAYTLDNEYVWNHTHRLGGYLFCISGMIIIISGFAITQYSFYIMMICLFSSIIILYIYSYQLHKKTGGL